jgi:hypothetical protein
MLSFRKFFGRMFAPNPPGHHAAPDVTPEALRGPIASEPGSGVPPKPDARLPKPVSRKRKAPIRKATPKKKTPARKTTRKKSSAKKR